MNGKVVISVVFFVCIFLSGFWLSRTGKPYSAWITNLHKIISLGAVVFLAITIRSMRNSIAFEAVHIIAIVVTTLCFLITIISGGLLCIDKPMPGALAVIHKLAPYLTVLSTAAALYLLLSESK